MTRRVGVPSWVSDLASQAEASTLGPWYVRRTDDPSFMAAYYVTSEKGAGALDVEKWDHARSVVAITVLQDPGLALTQQGVENADFIAAARVGVPRLCDAVERALEDRAALADAVRQLLATARKTSGATERDEAFERAQRLLDDLDRK